MYLETQRLIIRNYILNDIYDVYEYSCDKQVAIAAGWNVHENISTTLQHVIAMSRQENTCVIVDKFNNKVIGGIGLYHDSARHNDGCKSIGYALNRNYWGQGLITEAASAVLRYGFEILKLNLISASHYPFNGASARVLNKLGFKYEGTLRQCSVILEGNIYDELTYSITKEEFFNKLI